jgi:hypothetical protein
MASTEIGSPSLASARNVPHSDSCHLPWPASAGTWGSGSYQTFWLTVPTLPSRTLLDRRGKVHDIRTGLLFYVAVLAVLACQAFVPVPLRIIMLVYHPLTGQPLFRFWRAALKKSSLHFGIVF